MEGDTSKYAPPPPRSAHSRVLGHVRIATLCSPQLGVKGRSNGSVPGAGHHNYIQSINRPKCTAGKANPTAHRPSRTLEARCLDEQDEQCTCRTHTDTHTAVVPGIHPSAKEVHSGTQWLNCQRLSDPSNSGGSPNRAGGRVQQKIEKTRHCSSQAKLQTHAWRSRRRFMCELGFVARAGLRPNPPRRHPTNPTAHKPSRTLETRCLDAQCTCRAHTHTHSSGAGDPPQSTAASKHRRDATAHAPNFSAHDGSSSSTHNNPTLWPSLGSCKLLSVPWSSGATHPAVLQRQDGLVTNAGRVVVRQRCDNLGVAGAAEKGFSTKEQVAAVLQAAAVYCMRERGSPMWLDPEMSGPTCCPGCYSVPRLLA